MSSSTAQTVRFDPGTWAPPVERVEELWELAPEGQLCWVQSEDCVYQRRGKVWVPASPRRRA
ncbi:MAG: hypothetical protein R3F61_10350 [Myxococcota bacterium]